MLMVLGTGHHDVGLDGLTDIGASEASLRKVFADAIAEDDPAVVGAVVLSTCNRLEIYLEAARFHDAVDTATAALSACSALNPAAAQDTLRVRVGGAVAAHLFSVTAGLDSMVVGEAEIAGQVARAHRASEQDGTVSPVLHRLFRRAASTAKAVASQTQLGAEGRSVASVALDIAQQRRGSLSDLTVLVIGTGSYARVIAGGLRQRGCTDLRVYSPSGRGSAFARTHQARVVASAELAIVLESVDMVVAASGRGAGIGVSDDVIAAVAGRERPLIVVDLALEHDVPQQIRSLPTVDLIDLHTVAQAADPTHGRELQAAQALVLDAVSKFESEQVERSLDPAVVALRSHLVAAVETEVQRLRRKYDGEVADDVSKAFHRVTNSLLHTPTMRARELARDGSSEDYLKALHTLFGISLPEPSGTDPKHQHHS